MTSTRQIEANRRNALKSTGPRTTQGKDRSRRNALRHGLTSETVIGLLEDAKDYRAFEAAVIADYDAQSAVERELVLRLASLLWRLRRTTTMETALFEIQAMDLRELRKARQDHSESRETIYRMFGLTESVSSDADHGLQVNGLQASRNGTEAIHSSGVDSIDPAADLAHCFLRLANLPSGALDRLSRYEARLWRQVAQVLFTLNALERRKPQE